MQELKDEMTARIKTLERRISHCKNERQEYLGTVEALEREIKSNETLAAQYRQALSQLAVTLTYVGAYAAPTQ